MKKNNQIVFENSETTIGNKVCSLETLILTLDAMNGVYLRGSGKGLTPLGREYIYCKTGTSSNNRDALCLVITDNYILYITICRNNDQSLGAEVYGAKAPVNCAYLILRQLIFKDVSIIPKDIAYIIKRRKYLLRESKIYNGYFLPIPEEYNSIVLK